MEKGRRNELVCDDAEVADKTFNENLNNIYWYDGENELK